MSIKRELIGKLRDFGLNSYEAKLWLALLSRGTSTAGELSDISEVPRSRAYDVLESLEKKGFIIVKLGKPIRYLAVPPQDVIDRVKKKISEDAERKSDLLEGLQSSDLLRELTSLHSSGIEYIDPAEKTGAFRGRDKIYEHMSSMIKSANHSLVISTTAFGLQRKAEMLKTDLRRANARGVKVRIAAPITSENKRHAEELSQFAEVRHTAHPSRFVIADDHGVMVMLNDDLAVHENYDGGVWFTAPYFVKKLGTMFDREWEQLEKQ